MAATRTLAELFRAIGNQDIESAAAIAARICAGEEEKGHRTAARQLRGALHAAPKSNGKHSAVPPAENGVGASIVSTALVRLPDEVRLDDVALASKARGELDSIVNEWTKRDRLREHRLEPRSKLLFHGPPGCGKSMTARALAHELRIPIYVVRFDAVIGAYLGQTAIHLRQLFHYAETTPCVLLLDELDALGKRRGNPLDVGELDRIVIALMQELEHSNPQGLIIGTSNLPKHLDDALWRRFDLSLLFRSPTRKALADFARRIARSKNIRLRSHLVEKASAAANFADAEAIVIAEARRQALANA